MPEPTPEAVDQIRNTLAKHIGIWDGRRKRHGYMNNTMVVLGIALSSAVTIAGISGQSILAGICGAILTGILALQEAFPFSDLSFFYRVGVAEAEILKLDLDTRARTKREIETIERKVETLIRKMAQDIPRGQAVHDAVQTMRQEVREIS